MREARGSAAQIQPENDLLPSLIRVCREISSPEFASSSAGVAPLHRQSFSSAARKAKLLAVLFEDLLRTRSAADDDAPPRPLPRPAALCFEELLAVLLQLKSLLGGCAARSRVRLLLESDLVSSDLHDLSRELAVLLEVLPLRDLGVGDDVRDIVTLLLGQCRRPDPPPPQQQLRSELLYLIRDIEREIVPDRGLLERIFGRLGIRDGQSCGDEIDLLEQEIGDRAAGCWAPEMLAVLGLLRYAKYVLYSGFSTDPPPATAAAAEIAVPTDFRCPISLDLMRDPVVVVATGQTYDRESISRWIASGNATCPKTGQAMATTKLVPNRAVRSLIARWCRDEGVPFDAADIAADDPPAAVGSNKAAMEAARMTAAFLVDELAASPSPAAANRVVQELRQLSKSGAENRALAAEAGAIAALLPLLNSGDASLQLNAAAAILSLAALDANKKRLMHAVGGVGGVVGLLSEGATSEARGTAAAILLSLCSLRSYRKRLGKRPRVVEELVAMATSGGGASRDALAAILGLAGERENVPRLLEGGAVEAAFAGLGDAETAEAAAALIAAVAKRGGAEAVAAASGSFERLVGVLSRGSDRARESAAAALVLLCRRSGGVAVAEIAMAPGIESAICELVSSGTERARRKATSLARICRRWLVAEEVYLTTRTPAGAADIDAAP